MDTVVNDLQFIGSDLTFINKLVHSHYNDDVADADDVDIYDDDAGMPRIG